MSRWYRLGTLLFSTGLGLGVYGLFENLIGAIAVTGFFGSWLWQLWEA